MALFSRIVRLFKADFHSMLDQLEEPEAILNQALREMQEEITTTEINCKNLEAKINVLTKQNDSWRIAVDDLEKQIDICFEQNQEPLAKSLIRKKLETLRCLSACEQKQQLLTAQKSDIEEKLENQKEALTSIANQKRILTEKNPNQCTQNPGSLWEIPGADFSVTEAETEAAFLQEKSRRERDPAVSKTP